MSDDDDSAVVMISSRRTAPGNLFNLSSTTVWYDEVSAYMYNESDRSDVMTVLVSQSRDSDESFTQYVCM